MEGQFFVEGDIVNPVGTHTHYDNMTDAVSDFKKNLRENKGLANTRLTLTITRNLPLDVEERQLDLAIKETDSFPGYTSTIGYAVLHGFLVYVDQKIRENEHIKEEDVQVFVSKLKQQYKQKLDLIGKYWIPENSKLRSSTHLDEVLETIAKIMLKQK